MRTVHDVWTDPELRELITTDPDLVAVADAFAYASAAAGVQTRERRIPHRRAILAGVAVLVAAAATSLAMPWSRSTGSLADLALAAIGSDPVLHVVAERATGAQLVDVKSGDYAPVYQQQEIWFDSDKGLRREVVRDNAVTVAAVLETPQGAYSSSGRVYDCAWIAAHPAEATAARVSCTGMGVNPAAPTAVARPKPTLDPGLEGFVDGYRAELASGVARKAGGGTVDGKAVDWLVFPTSNGDERVALDQATHKPMLIEEASGQHLRITTIETTAFSADDFTRPAVAPSDQHASAGEATTIAALGRDAASVKAAVPGALWLGTTVDGLDLVRVEHQALVTTFADGTTTRSDAGLELAFGRLKDASHLDFQSDYVVVSEAPTRALGFGNMWGFVHGADPPTGQLYLATPSSSTGGTPGTGDASAIGFFVYNGVYVTIRTSSAGLLLDAARQLRSN